MSKGGEDGKIHGCLGLSLLDSRFVIVCFICKKRLKWERNVEAVSVWAFHPRNCWPDFYQMLFSEHELNLLAKLILLRIFPIRVYLCMYIRLYNTWFIFYKYNICKGQQSLCKRGQALRFPEGWGSQISRQSAHEGGKVVSPTHRPPFPPGNIPGTCFC